MFRFLNRSWRLIAEGAVPLTQDAASKDQLKALHKTIKKVTADTDKLSFNTAIAAMMEFVSSGSYHHRGYTIAGGSSEVQHNIIAKQVLGL